MCDKEFYVKSKTLQTQVLNVTPFADKEGNFKSETCMNFYSYMTCQINKEILHFTEHIPSLYQFGIGRRTSFSEFECWPLYGNT